MKHTLQFLNPSWHYGPNATVRLGNRWHQKSKAGDEVELVRTGREGEILAVGIIDEVRFCLFRELPLWVLIHEHDRECSTVEGLTWAMLRAYPDFDSLESYVTVVLFNIK